MLRLFPVLLLFACIGSSVPQAATDIPSATAAEQKPKQESYLFTDSLRDIRFLVSTHMHMSMGVQCSVDAITVSAKGAKEPFQRLAIENMTCPCPMPDGQFPAVQLLDYDFNGSKDISIMEAAADLTNAEHRYWLWDAATNQFTSSRMLDSIQQPMFDHDRQMVSSQWYAGPGHRGGSTYKYENGTLTMVSNMEKFTEGDHERWVIWGMKDGTFQPVQEKQVPLAK
ncbi:MAG: hypothetical protein IPP33_09190 [Flavobacteriales bacterium]|nr:hypothetical protein [Flavobacteriales bacterium]